MSLRYFWVVLLMATFSLNAQIEQLQFDEKKWPLHKVVHYSKSNWDGSNKGFVSIYFKDHQWIESLKWHQGHGTATVVPAKIDHLSFNVIHFKNLRCQHGTCNQQGEMYWDPKIKGYVLALGEIRDTVKNIPGYWHSYDFDFGSLMAAWLFKTDSANHRFDRADFQKVEGDYLFGPMGAVLVSFKTTSLVSGVLCDIYEIDGEGLQHQGGEIWFDRKTKLMRGFKIKLPDENSYQDVLFEYLDEQQMTAEQWENFKAKTYR